MTVDRTHRRRRRLASVQEAARVQGNVISRRQLYALGYSRGEVRAEVRAGRWRRRGDMCVQVGDREECTAWWHALLEIGPTAVLDGITSLLAAGLKTVSADRVHVAAPKSSRPRPCHGVRVHETRRLRAEDIDRTGVPRTKTATAAVHAALWARTDAEAALMIIAPFQQRLVSAAELTEAIAQVKRHRRRRLLHGLLRDVCDGVESIAEREFAQACRRRGFPEPTRQVARHLPSGRVVYDTVWTAFRTKAEIDGVQHLDAAAAARDALKQNAAAVDGWSVVRIPNFAFRANAEPFLDQIEAALRAGGWNPSLRPSQRAS